MDYAMEQMILSRMSAINNGIIKQTHAFNGLSYAITDFRLGEELQLARSSYNGDTPARYQKKALDVQLKGQQLVDAYRHINSEFCGLYREGIVTLDYAKSYGLASARNLMDLGLEFHALARNAANARTQCENFLTYQSLYQVRQTARTASNMRITEERY